MDNKDKMFRTEPINEQHEITLTNRRILVMSGVKEVVSFNEKQVRLDTVQGPCVIEGDDLNIQQLSLENGKMRIEGLINSISYNVKGHKGFMNRVFK